MSGPYDNPFKRLIREIHRRSLWQVLGIYLDRVVGCGRAGPHGGVRTAGLVSRVRGGLLGPTGRTGSCVRADRFAIGSRPTG